MTLVRRLVLAAAAVVLVAFVLLRPGRGGSLAESLGTLAILLLLATAMAALAGHLLVRPLHDLGHAIRQIAAGTTPRLTRTGVPEFDALIETIRQLHGDIGDRFEQLRRERRDATVLIEAMTEGVIAADTRGHITLANPAARRLLGYDDQATLPELTTLFRAKPAREAIGQLLTGETVRDRELELDDRTLLLNARPFEDRGVLIVLHDLTALRRLETVRRDFIANASHELKTPLTSIAGYAETLQADADDMDPATRGRFLETILNNARRMQQLVDDLLDLSRIESGRWAPVPVAIDLTRAAEESWQLVGARVAAQRATLDLVLANDTATLRADPETIRQLFGNLFDNALRYLPIGGTVTVRSIPYDGGTLLSVEDNGGGIPAIHLPRIFERFYRVDPSRSREEGGTGLGLSIVKHQVEAHGGRVWAESTLREGTTIHCWFPAIV